MRRTPPDYPIPGAPDRPTLPETVAARRPRPRDAFATTWSFNAGDKVPDWLMRQTNCVLTFSRAVVLVERNASFDLYPVTAMVADEAMILAEVLHRRRDVDVEHVSPIVVHASPRSGSE
jgi:hypothetical protein